MGARSSTQAFQHGAEGDVFPGPEQRVSGQFVAGQGGGGEAAKEARRLSRLAQRLRVVAAQGGYLRHYLVRGRGRDVRGREGLRFSRSAVRAVTAGGVASLAE